MRPSDKTVRHEDRQPRTEPRADVLVLVNDAGVRVVPLPRARELVVGRATDADITLADELVSRHHARILAGPPYRVDDLASSNGTFVRGERLEPGIQAAVYPGDNIQIGSTLIFLRMNVPTVVARVEQTSIEPPVLGQAMTKLLAMADRAAPHRIPVLVLGETGVGKDVLAQRIHDASPRRERPLQRLNCAAFTPALLESELFGYEKGAFTGALVAAPGLLRSAEGGTVFLDEIAELPLDLQAKLLLVIERLEVRPIGGTRPQPIDVRFIAATNGNLLDAVERGSFRRDLYFRLNGVSLTLPPLRERTSEIEGLALSFAHQAACSIGRAPPEMGPGVIDFLRRQPWPGNIRELRSLIERVVILGLDGAIELDDLEACAGGAQAPHGHVVEPGASKPGGERERVVRTLEQCGGNQSRAAKVLGISRNALIARIRKYELVRPKGARRSGGEDG